MQEQLPNQGVTVKIFGSEYTIRASQDPGYLKELADYVDAKMREIASGGMASSTKVAVLAALNITDELKSLERGIVTADDSDKLEDIKEEYTNRAAALIQLIDEHIS